jgi:ATP-dependent DNA helicase RecG
MSHAASEKSATELLATPIQFVKGVGPQRAELLERLELRNVRDVLFDFPRDYQDMSELRPIEQLEDGQSVSVCGIVDEVDMRNTGTGRSMLGVLLRQGTQFLRAIWFNQPFMANKFSVGQRILLSGNARLKGFRWEMTHPRVTILGENEEPPAGKILPVYSLTEGLSQPQMRRVVQNIIEQYHEIPEEVFPAPFLAEHQLLSISQALLQIHQPASRELLERARFRFIFQEVLVMQLALAWRRWKLVHQRRAPALATDAKIDARIVRLFPFELTGDQRQAMAAIAGDMGHEFPMNRLVHGEVGSGKTVVAQYAMLLCVAHGHQAVLMAPTEVLARQHARTLAKALEQSRVRLALLTGGLTPSLRRETLASLAAGTVDILVGTQAVLGDDVKFAKLGLVIIDEQHKFGVRQRAILRQAGFDPHYLVMTATPIPRTVSLTLFGDLDISTLHEMPPGRQAVHTYLADDEKRARWWDFVRQKLREGRQAYVIAPLVDESENVPLANAERLFESLTNSELEAFRVDILHGRQSADEKDAALERFRRGEVQVLVSTLVVEVGVDVPNATLMTIESAERFGLAQLHQLRGRVSRGIYPGYVCLFANTENEEAKQRLEKFCNTPNGFDVAELDFRLRGPGDMLGWRQHGLPPFRIADLVRDADIVLQAREVAHQLIATDPELNDPAWAKMRRMVQVRYGEVMELAEVG